MKQLYEMRRCKHCKQGFAPLYPHQQMCRECGPERRRKYRRDWFRRERRKLKESLRELEY